MHLQRSSLRSCAFCACACSGVSCIYVFHLLWLLLLIMLGEPSCLIRLLACRCLSLGRSGKASIMVAVLAETQLVRGAQGGKGRAEEAYLRHLPLASASSTHLRTNQLVIATPWPITLTKRFMQSPRQAMP